MKSILSSNEKAVFEIVFKEHDPDIKLLCYLLRGSLIDKHGFIVQEEPDMRFVSKLKSTGLKKVSDSLFDLANSSRLDTSNFSRKYSEKIKACYKGFNFMLNVEVYVIFLLEEGPIAWYVHDSKNCSECKSGGVCHKTLEQIVIERSLKFPEELIQKEIDEKANWVFNQLLK